MKMRIDKFVPLSDLTTAQAQNDDVVLEALRRTMRLSIWDVTAGTRSSDALGTTIQRLRRAGKIALDNDSTIFPCIAVTILDAPGQTRGGDD